MGILGDVLGAASSIWSSNQANSAAFQMQANSLAAQKEALQNRHQWEVADLRKAGLNPILSANSGAGGISGATANVTAPDIAGAINKIANSAFAKKQTELAEKELDVKQDQANASKLNAAANYLEAEVNQSKANSAIELNQANTKYLGILGNYQNVKAENETAMTKMNIKKTEQDIINAVQQTAATIEYLRKTGDAALTSASAAARNAAAQEVMASVAAQNGISLRQLQGAMTQKNLAEIGEVSARINRINAEADKTTVERNILYNRYPLTSGKDENTGLRQDLFGAGELMKILSPFTDLR